jgi:hypothetical protein
MGDATKNVTSVHAPEMKPKLTGVPVTKHSVTSHYFSHHVVMGRGHNICTSLIIFHMGMDIARFSVANATKMMVEVERKKKKQMMLLPYSYVDPRFWIEGARLKKNGWCVPPDLLRTLAYRIISTCLTPRGI